MILAVDFDGTLCENRYPEIGAPDRALIDSLIVARSKGDKLILWTCREGIELDEAVEFCKSQGLEFDAVNDNVPETIELFGSNNRKIFAHYYIDDKSLRPEMYHLIRWRGNEDDI